MRTILLIFFISALLGGIAAADTVPYVVVMRFLPEAGSGPEWIGPAISTGISWRLAKLPEIDLVPWRGLRDLFDEDGIPWPERAFTSSELADLARRGEAQFIVAGRYRVSSRGITVHIRVFDGRTCRDSSIDLKSTEPQIGDGQVAERVASIILPSTPKSRLDDMQRPVVGSAESFEMLGRITENFWSGHNIDRACRESARWLKIDPHSAIAEYRTATLYEDRSKPLPHCRRATELAPDQPLVWSILASSAERGTERRDSMRKCILLNPNDVTSHLTLAMISEEVGDVGAIGREGHIARVLSHNCIDRNAVGRWYYQHARRRSAVNTLRSALRPGVPRCRTLRRLGAIYYSNGDFRHSIEAWDRALAVRPSDSWLLQWSAVARARMREFDGADRMILRAIKAAPNDAGVWYSRGWILYLEGNYRSAEVALKKSIQLDPEDMSAHRLLLEIYEAQHEVLAGLSETIVVNGARGTAWGVLIGLTALYLLALFLIVMAVRRALRPDGPRRRPNEE